MGLLEIGDRSALSQGGADQVEALYEHPMVPRGKAEMRRVIPASHDAIVNVDRYPVGQRIRDVREDVVHRGLRQGRQQ